MFLFSASVASGTIAVVDSGVDSSHPELSGRVQQVDFTGPGLPPLPGGVGQDADGHGTAVASIAAGRTLGIAGQEPILDLKVVGPATGAPVGPGAEAAAQEALDWVLRQEEPPRVVLLSFAGEQLSEEGASTLAAQAARLWEQNVLVVAPAGDHALSQEPRVLTVAGESTCRRSGSLVAVAKPDLRAPDQGLTAAEASLGTGTGGTVTVSGPEFAAAQVAGAAARILDAHPDMPVDAVASILRGSVQADDACPVGVLDVPAAVAVADAWVDPLEAPPGQDTPTPFALAPLLVALLVARRR